MYNLSLLNLSATTSCSALLESVLANAPTLYCVVPFVVACVEVSGIVLSGPFRHNRNFF